MKRSKAARRLLPVHLGGDLLCSVGAAGRFRCKYPTAQLPPSHGNQSRLPGLSLSLTSCLLLKSHMSFSIHRCGTAGGGGIACYCFDKTL